ncbi:MAG: hypothetical protein GY953_37890, partial [bacterium]|nr:hypothetical protein [bacterium]
DVAVRRAASPLGERALGREFFEENRGDFWAIVETRPYMRARFDLACELLKADRRREAISHMNTLIGLNPNDNQGVRDYLLPAFFAENDLAGAQRLLDRYEGDGSAIHIWGRVLERYLAGAVEEASEELELARERNPHAEAFLTGHRPLPRGVPDYYAYGRESEAVYCALMLRPAWAAHPEAVHWLDSRRALSSVAAV